VSGRCFSATEWPTSGCAFSTVASSGRFAGFSLVEVAVASSEALSKVGLLARGDRGDPHPALVEGPPSAGTSMSPTDGLIVQLHTPEHPTVEES